MSRDGSKRASVRGVASTASDEDHFEASRETIDASDANAMEERPR